MITRVSGADSAGMAKDPRRKSQRPQFKHSCQIPYKSSYEMDYRQQQKNALWSSASIIMGSLIFMIGYYMLTRRVKE